jgi:hypothetical protein
MKTQCGICEYHGDWDSAPLFLCFTCADAIRRLVWIRTREHQAAEARLSIPTNNSVAELSASFVQWE